MANVKSILSSKTVWFNLVLIIGGICQAIASQSATGVTVSVIGAIGIALRYVTTTAVTMKWN
jgi:hypothetical protein